MAADEVVCRGSEAQRERGFGQLMASLKPEAREWWTGPVHRATCPFLTH